MLLEPRAIHHIKIRAPARPNFMIENVKLLDLLHDFDPVSFIRSGVTVHLVLMNVDCADKTFTLAFYVRFHKLK